MKNFTLKFSILILVICAAPNVIAQSTAEYIITFSSVWESTAVDPIDGNSTAAIPGNAHWSNLVGATHNNGYTMLEMGSLASLGIKDVAERGLNTNLFNEVSTQITNGNADQWLQEPFSPFAAVSSSTLSNVVVSSDYPLLSLVAMIAPSPDWMIAINSVNLRDGGSWVNGITIPLFPYDAGTDSGTTYGASDQITNPAEPISVLINSSPFNANPIGTMTITLNQVLSVDDNDIDKIIVYPNPTSGILNISATRSNTLKIASVYDILGKQVYQHSNANQLETVKLDLTNLNDGVYMLKTEFQDGSFSTKRILIN